MRYLDFTRLILSIGSCSRHILKKYQAYIDNSKLIFLSYFLGQHQQTRNRDPQNTRKISINDIDG